MPIQIIIPLLTFIFLFIGFWLRVRQRKLSIERVPTSISSASALSSESKDDDLGDGVELQETEEKTDIHPLCRIRGHDWDDPREEMVGMPRNEMAWIMGDQPTYQQYRRCQREGCKKTNRRTRTNIVTPGPWKDIY